ncbi:MAG: sodium-dependent bicarbonate transport family permease [Verrucomicrobia bacterium]|nr:MAG: sodium-dependent bicarbonate transport family permease [Verrucomicrobiota bacterium]TAE87151.1 MAG: sodium-dependent bicarbonate transport family permease [Verrucomicrobiota bacterium]TAF24955.1 MAG: sodium-dependent bicarbonate transport family permease [Verrucomicrobiota bacterium]TAF40718.1 MAG: sodium-dependent bicarbonate transport family permease [Verrucomicrobiota bacterium]
MMHLLLDNLLSPVVLAFVLGLLACLARSDLRLPEPIFQGLSIYLLLAIGMKGGAAVASAGLERLVLPGIATLALGVATPLIAFGLMHSWGRLDRINAAAVAAHFGSVSAVTFLVANEAAQRSGLGAEDFLTALVAILEIPGIVIALLLARRGDGPAFSKDAIAEVLTGKSIVLLAGGTLIGYLSSPAQWASVQPFFVTPFKGVLCLFLLELGAMAGRRLKDIRHAGMRPVLLAMILPIIHGSLGVGSGLLAGLDPGSAAVLGVMAASASYIAAPAAVRIALPEASPGLYLSLSLGVTFPFNLALGIPWCLFLARYLAPLVP